MTMTALKTPSRATSERLPPPPSARTIAWIGKPAHRLAQVDQQLRHLDRAAVAFQHRHVPPDAAQPLLKMRPHPERSRTAEDDDLRAVIFDCCHGLGDGALQHLRPFATLRVRLLGLDRPRGEVGGPWQRI